MVLEWHGAMRRKLLSSFSVRARKPRTQRPESPWPGALPTAGAGDERDLQLDMSFTEGACFRLTLPLAE